MTEWIVWKGGERPVSHNTLIEVRYRSGGWTWGLAGEWELCWQNNGVSDDIVAYRVLSEEPEPDQPEKRRSSAQPDADGWIEWSGGECPVPPDTLVEVLFRNGETDYTVQDAATYCWDHVKCDQDIISYRVVDDEAEPDSKPDLVNSPSHYTDGGIETIDFIEAKLGAEGFLGFCLGNALKYISRAGKKDNLEQDLSKAIWYLKKAGGK